MSFIKIIYPGERLCPECKGGGKVQWGNCTSMQECCTACGGYGKLLVHPWYRDS